jgi:hypothetical protein
VGNLNIPVMQDELDFAEAMRQIHASVAFSENNAIAMYDSVVYRTTKAALFVAIGAAYPEADIKRVYDIWVDCNESIAYCVVTYFNAKRDETDMTVMDGVLDIEDMADEVRKN